MEDTGGDYVAAEAYEELEATLKDTVDALESALKTAEFERHPFRPWQGQARSAIAKATDHE